MYGLQIDMLPWEKVYKILPKYSKFTVLDVETGKRFHVQRRAGSRHADVQPLTPKDTTIMKEIYGGKWSWKRRAIIVIHRRSMDCSLHARNATWRRCIEEQFPWSLLHPFLRK